MVELRRACEIPKGFECLDDTGAVVWVATQSAELGEAGWWVRVELPYQGPGNRFYRDGDTRIRGRLP